MTTLTRRDFFVTSSVTLGTIGRAFSQEQVQTSFDPLRGYVGVFTGRGGSIGMLVAPDGVVVVDAQFQDTAKIALGNLQQMTRRKIDVLINTHHHGDHTSGNIVFRPAAVKIVAHRNVPIWQKTQAVAAKSEAQQAYADTTYDTTVGESRRRNRLPQVLRTRPYQRRQRRPIPERQCGAHGRPHVLPAEPTGRSSCRGVGQELDCRARVCGQRQSCRYDLYRRPFENEPSCHCDARRSAEIPRLFLWAPGLRREGHRVGKTAAESSKCERPRFADTKAALRARFRRRTTSSPRGLRDASSRS